MKRTSTSESPLTPTSKYTNGTSSPLARSSPYATQDLPSSKRRRVDSPASYTPTSTSQPPTPSEPEVPIAVSIEAARARAKYLRDCGESEWVIDLPPSTSVALLSTNGGTNSPVDYEEESNIWAQETVGKQTYGSFKRKSKQTLTPKDEETDDDLSSGSSDEESDSGLEQELQSKRVRTSTRPGMTSMRQPKANLPNRYHQGAQVQKNTKPSGSKR